MQARSAHSLVSDPYRAGAALGDALVDLAPEVVFLFSSVHYGEPPELLDGLYDALGNDAVVVVGNSGDGCLEAGVTTDHGVAALGINTGGKVRWQAVVESGASADPAGCTRRALAALRASLGEEPGLIYMACDFRADAGLVEAVLHDELDIPVVGGYAADDNRMLACYLYVNRQIVHDAVVLLGLAGDFRFDIRIGNTLPAVGEAGVVESAEGTQLHRIGGQSAVDFIASQTGKPVLQSDRGMVSFTIINPERSSERRLRSIVPAFSIDQGTLGLYGGIEEGKRVQVCLANPAQLTAEVNAIAEEVTRLDFTPAAGIIVSCAGRKWLMGGNIGNETKALNERFPHGLPLVGYPSFGEIGPLRDEQGYTGNLFHNMTYVLLLG
jgi:hypothetical protein